MAITKSDIKKFAQGKSYQRGEEYLNSNAVIDIQKRGNILLSEVAGSNDDSYDVRVELSKDSIISTSCTCPYDWGGICKHVVAVLLNYIHKPESIEELPTVSELLVNLKESELREILLDLLESEPHLVTHVETKIASIQIDRLKTQSLSASPHQPLMIDLSLFKKQAKQIFKNSARRGYYDHYDDEDDEDDYADISEQFMELFGKAKPLLEAGEANSALLILDAVMDTFVSLWSDNEGYYDDISDMLDQVSLLFAEAILSIDLSEKEKKNWKTKLTEWQDEMSDYVSSDSFEAPLTALEQGWDYPPLKSVLDGNDPEQGAWEMDEDGEYPDYAHDFNVIRLRVLERKGLNQEYLYLAEAEGLTEYYLTMLVKLGRSKEAVQYALQYGLLPYEAMIFCNALGDKGLIEDALKIADHALSAKVQDEASVRDNNFLLLARWLRDNGQKQANMELALKGAEAAFKYSFDLKDYLSAESIAKAADQWEQLKTDLLAQLKKKASGDQKVDIYLHEGMHRQIIEVVDKGSGWWGDFSKIESVVDAVCKEFPAWAIRQCMKQAEPNMNAGKSKYYVYSVRWVEKAGKIYVESNRRNEWSEYLEGLIKKHHLKYSLRPQLEALRKL